MNILVIGGTGMLAEACIKLSYNADNLVVIAQRRKGLDDLGSKVPNRCNYFGVSVNWHDYEAIKDSLTKLNLKFSLIIAWIHSDAESAHKAVARFCSLGSEYFDITGHSGIKPDHVTYTREKDIESINPGIGYHRVILGSKNGRCLTNSEISQGVLNGINLNKKVYTVGEC